jgi:uncharacterized protein (DUF4415 family)
MQKEYDIEKLKVKRRGIHPQLSHSNLENSKIKVTISLDKDIIDFFKGQAKESGALPYQTQINQTLRTVLPSSKTGFVAYEKIKKELLDDKKFVFSLKKRLLRTTHIGKKGGNKHKKANENT